jgi:hypothetical protein
MRSTIAAKIAIAVRPNAAGLAGREVVGVEVSADTVSSTGLRWRLS